MRVIGICGTNGSGKGLLVEILKKHAPVVHVSGRQLIIDFATRDGINIESRLDMREYANHYIKTGKSIILEYLKGNIDDSKIYIFESIRRVQEISDIRSLNCKTLIISVDADPNLRYQRAVKRNSVTDHVDFKNFMLQEKLESEGTEQWDMNIPKCVELADIKLINNGNQKDFEEQIKKSVLGNPFFQL